MRLLDSIRHILYADSFVSKHKADDEHRSQRGIGLIAIAAFLVMSILNVEQHSFIMLTSTLFSAAMLFTGYLISRYKNISSFLRMVFYIIFVVIFTSYTIMGGNEGFSALWLVIATPAVMIAIDFKAGFLIGLYYLVMLIMLFKGPLTPLLQYDYNKTFMLRFPFLYAINFAFAVYIVIRIRMYQYEILLKQQELEYLSRIDLDTGLMNRNNFIHDVNTFTYDGLQTLSVIFIDVNGLHELNNRDGHDAGDKMLVDIADLCKTAFPTDSVYRIGGDEFIILRKNAAETDTASLARKLFQAVEEAGYSISYGVDTQNTDFDLSRIVKNADDKMMIFKREYYKRHNRKRG